MWEAIHRLRPMSGCLLVGFFAISASVVSASEAGAVAGAFVEQSSYRHYLDNELYTHYGDDRRWGPEHDLAQANIAAFFQSFGLTVTLEPVLYGGETYYNVVGTKPGMLDPTVEYVVGGHYDSDNNYDFAEFGAPGADDNASGVALVLEAARVLTEYDSDYTIRFVAFDREERPQPAEDGLLGAWAYAVDHIGDDIRGVINVDMIAYNIGTDTVGIGRTLESSDPLRDAMTQAVNAYGDGLGLSFAYVGPGDHQPFEQVGFQAVMVHEDLGNPCYHRGCDSVDTPGYLDYDLATRITRVVVGFLVDHAGVHIDIPDGDFTGDGIVDMADFAEFEACFEGPGIPVTPPCDFFDLDANGDLDCTDWRLFKAVWTEPGDPPAFWGCRLPAPIALGQSGRSLLVTAPVHTRPLALLVEGHSLYPVVSCVAAYVQDDGRLGPNPLFQTHDAWGTVAVTGNAIVPATYYTISCDYGELGLSMSSAAAETTMWGDVVGDFHNGQWTPADGTVDFVDISSVVDAFRHLPTAPPVAWADLVGAATPCLPMGLIDFNDISAAVEAFKGSSFWETTSCPPPCQ